MKPDEAYANSVYIPDGEAYYARWDAKAAAFRTTQPAARFGPLYDFYPPADAPRGTMIFVHGGYWMAGSPTMFSHLAAGALAAGYACALASYTLAPQARIRDMTREIAARINEVAKACDGPLYLVGHSAGAHLVARMACVDMTADWSARVRRIMAISPLCDLAPLMDTSMNDTLRIDAVEARSESPIHHARQGIPVTAWVGSDERPAFLGQAKALYDAWDCDLTVEPDRHHFDVIEGLENPISPMMRALLR
jgi:acetyl esterase/lipase